MGLVYRQANHTVIYLGEGTSETNMFLNALQSKATAEYFASLSGNADKSVKSLDTEIEDAARKWILSRPWFRRVWILQELVLSQDPWIQCGSYSARWSSFYNHISEMANTRKLESEGRIAQSMGDLHLQHQTSERAENLPDFARRLYDLLKSRKGSGVTDPRDMLFANLGLITRAEETEDKLFNLIVVDYEKTEGQVYRDLAYYFLEDLGAFRIFSLLDSSEKRSNTQAPSWAPDWAAGHLPGFSRISDLLAYDHPKCDFFHIYWASDSQVLACDAQYIGQVEGLTKVIDQSPSPQIARGFSELLEKGPVSVKDHYQFIKSAFEETYHGWRHLLGTLIPDPATVLHAIEEQVETIQDWFWFSRFRITEKEWYRAKFAHQEYLVFQDIRSFMNDFMDSQRDPLIELGLSYVQPWPWSQRHQSLFSQIVFSSFVANGPNPFYSRRIATLVKDAIALVPESTNIGDTVSLPVRDKYPVPLVLRPCLTTINEGIDAEIRQQFYAKAVEHFTIVGECFMQGWMHGERPEPYEKAPKSRHQVLALH